MKRHRKLIIVAATLLALIVIAIVGYAIPARTTDGTENYTGVKLEAAKKALEYDYIEYGPALFLQQSKPHVEKIEPTTNEWKCTDDPSKVTYYTVTIRRIWLFGMTYGIKSHDMCRVSG